jgi:GT2 family glycosyltransferase
MTEPALSVVVASVNGFPYLGRCLDALRERCPQAEVIVADWTDEASRERIRREWPEVRLISLDEPTPVPRLRAVGIAQARAPYVAVIEDHCVVEDGWAGRVLEAHRAGHPVVGGSIRNVADRRVRDWAAFLCEYSEHMEPAPGGAVPSLPGMNVSYSREAVAAMGDFLRRGMWETWLHPHLVACGFQLYCDPAAVVGHDKDFGVREFLGQRYHYARAYAGMRNAELGWKRALYCLGSPLLVPLVSYRIARNVLRRRRHRRELLLAAPLVFRYIAAWTAGEAVGYALGGGASLLRVK